MINRIWSVTLSVADLDRAVRFYQEVLGLTKKYQFQDYAGFDCGGVEIGIKTWGDREPARQGEPRLDFLVEDVDSAFQKLQSKGGPFSTEPKDTQWGGRIAIFHDPDGNTLQLTGIHWSEYFTICAQG